jgi:hypothetical protein
LVAVGVPALVLLTALVVVAALVVLAVGVFELVAVPVVETVSPSTALATLASFGVGVLLQHHTPFTNDQVLPEGAFTYPPVSDTVWPAALTRRALPVVLDNVNPVLETYNTRYWLGCIIVDGKEYE